MLLTPGSEARVERCQRTTGLATRMPVCPWPEALQTRASCYSSARAATQILAEAVVGIGGGVRGPVTHAAEVPLWPPAVLIQCHGHPAAGLAIGGTYAALPGEHHGEALYRRSAPPEPPAFLYYWDEAPQDEASGGARRHQGWWLGPEIGGIQTWAQCLRSEGAEGLPSFVPRKRERNAVHESAKCAQRCRITRACVQHLVRLWSAIEPWKCSRGYLEWSVTGRHAAIS